MGKTPFSFDSNDITEIRSQLLAWYAKEKRDLPWRKISAEADRQQHAYAVWVSEIMLQQTRVATVIDYYNRWMLNWPTVQDLANAELATVNEMWAGLGYYSRARRLHEGAQIVSRELNGHIPETSKALMKQIPGVGRYTAAAISSIAFNESAGVLDGNVIRVLSRLLTIGGDVTSKNVLDHMWKLVDMLITQEKPGDFNQAMMELGAIVCTPKNPQCTKCPLQSVCRAFAESEEYNNENSITVEKNAKRKSNSRETSKSRKRMKTIAGDHVDIEGCVSHLILPPGNPWAPELGVMNYPRKAMKKAPRQEVAIVCVIELLCKKELYYVISQRPESGLLAGLWEFPTIMLKGKEKVGEVSEILPDKNSWPPRRVRDYVAKHTDTVIKKYLVNTETTERAHKGEYTHIFSHIHLRYIIDHIKVTVPGNVKVEMGVNLSEHDSPWRWISKQDLGTSAMSTAMHKILKICNDKTIAKGSKKQRSLDSFFKPLKSNNMKSE